MKNYVGKVLGLFFLLLSFSYLPSTTLAEDASSPGPQWQAIPAYGPELTILADWQGTSADNATDTNVIEDIQTEDSETSDTMAANPYYNMFGQKNSLLGMDGGYGSKINESFNGMFDSTRDSFGIDSNAINNFSMALLNASGALLIPGARYGITDKPLQPYSYRVTSNTTPKVNTTTSKNTSSTQTVAANSTKNTTALSGAMPFGKTTTNAIQGMWLGLTGGTVNLNNATPMQRAFVTNMGTDIPISPTSTPLTADFDPSTPGNETKWYSPLMIDVDTSGTIALDGGTIPFDIAPHLAGLETIPVPAEGKDMFLVWDKAGTETIEGAVREYKEGEIIDITELFGPEDYTRSDFSVLAYSDDGFTKLAKLCDVNKDGRVDKQDTALSAEVAAKLKLWSPLSGELVLFKDTGIVIDARAGSYERHPSDVEGWAVEYKMKDAQDNLVGYQWLTSKTGSLLCVDVLLAVQ